MVNDILPYESLSLLNMKHFSCLTAPKYLQEFLDANLMTENSFFQISSMAFEFLLIQFLHYDFSVSNFGVSIKAGLLKLPYSMLHACTFRWRKLLSNLFRLDFILSHYNIIKSNHFHSYVPIKKLA